MDKSTFSKWGALVAAILVIAIMISFASPFSHFIANGAKSTLLNFKNTTNSALAGTNSGSGGADNEGPGAGGEDDEGGSATSYTVTLTTNNSEAGSVEFTSNGHSGTSVSLTGEQTLTFSATCNSGYQFLGWYVGETQISADAVYTEGYTVSSETSIEARFKAHLAPGIYETGTMNLTTSWEDLISNGVLNSDGSKVSGQETNLAGDLVLPNTLTSLPDSAYVNCSNLTSITIPDSVTSIGKLAFQQCSSLTSITIPDSVTSIGSTIFYNNKNLKTVYYEGTIEQWCNITLPGSNSNPCCYGAELYINGALVTDIVIPSTVTEIKDYTFYGCTSLTSVTIPDSVTSIGRDAFLNCTSLTSITIPDSVASIGSSAFRGCTSLTSVTIPDGVTAIDMYTFYGCTSLTSVTIPDSVTTIGESAFKNCTSLTSVTIPDSVASIGNYAFQQCSSLASITILAETPPELGSNALYQTASNKKIKVPASSLDAYKAQKEWKDLAYKMEPID